jgi:hypothetical protein
MKLSIVFPWVLLASAFAFPTLAETVVENHLPEEFIENHWDEEITENQIRVIFNDGVISDNMQCDDVEVETILEAILKRRFLREDTTSRSYVNQESDIIQERDLQSTFYPATCKTACAGFAKGTCTAKRCRGYRRDRHEMETGQEVVTMDESARALQKDWCERAKKQANNYLRSVIAANKVSSSCIQLLSAPRTMDCLIVTC